MSHPSADDENQGVSLPSLGTFLRKEGRLILLAFIGLLVLGGLLLATGQPAVRYQAVQLVDVGRIYDFRNATTLEVENPAALTDELKSRSDISADRPRRTYKPELIKIATADPDKARAREALAEVVQPLLERHRQTYQTNRRALEQRIELLDERIEQANQLSQNSADWLSSQLNPAGSPVDKQADAAPVKRQAKDEVVIVVESQETPMNSVSIIYNVATQRYDALTEQRTQLRYVLENQLEPTRAVGEVEVTRRQTQTAHVGWALLVSASLLVACLVGVAHFGWTQLLRGNAGRR